MPEKICPDGHVFIGEVCDRCGQAEKVEPTFMPEEEKVENTEPTRTIAAPEEKIEEKTEEAAPEQTEEKVEGTEDVKPEEQAAEGEKTEEAAPAEESKEEEQTEEKAAE